MPPGDPGDDGAADGLTAAAVDGEEDAGAGAAEVVTGDDEFTTVVEGDVGAEEAAVATGELGPEVDVATAPKVATRAAGGENALLPSDRTPAADAAARRASTRWVMQK